LFDFYKLLSSGELIAGGIAMGAQPSRRCKDIDVVYLPDLTKTTVEHTTGVNVLQDPLCLTASVFSSSKMGRTEEADNGLNEVKRTSGNFIPGAAWSRLVLILWFHTEKNTRR
jgi:hypothetical protein